MTTPPLNDGEKYVGVIISADGSRNHHIILLPGAFEGPWKKSMEWAESIGGELPDRVESALLFATMNDEFKEAAYWTREQHASASSFAWYQHFGYGHQDCHLKYDELRARAVRRLVIE